MPTNSDKIIKTTPLLIGSKCPLLGAWARFAPSCAGCQPQQQLRVNTSWLVRSIRSTVICTVYRAIYTRCDYQARASICERFSMKTGQRGMKFSMKRMRGHCEAASACDCYATSPYSSSYRSMRVSRRHPV
ncbi:hypothetical protein Y032_0057g2765 [Ancylostoma ceylanicum]|nr:hypothetical protein Y032_0057g2765 [Ancylostoma ceylanicum]